MELKGRQSSGPKGVDQLCFHTYWVCKLSSQADSRLERAYSRLERADFRPVRADFMPERAWGDGLTDRWMDGRTDG